MGIGTSDGKYYDDETAYVFDQFQNTSASTSKDQSTSGESVHTTGSGTGYSVNQKEIDELVAAAPNFANNPVIDQMTATAERSRPELKVPGMASAAPLGSDMSEVVARPTDPSVDSFIDRYGVWNTHDHMQKILQDERRDKEINSRGNFKIIPPGTRSWPSGNVISDAQSYPIEGMQQYAANFEGRGSDFEGPYMHQQPYNEQHRQNLLNRAPVHKGADPALWEGTAADRRKSIQERLDKTQDQHDQDFERFKSDWEELVKEGKAKPLSKEDSAPEAHIFRVRKDNPAIREYLQDIPEDVEAFDMNDGTVVLKKKAALTSMNDATPDGIVAGQQYAMMDEDARKSGKVIRPDWGAGGSRATSGGSVPGKSEVVQSPTAMTPGERAIYGVLKDPSGIKTQDIKNLQKNYPEDFKKAYGRVLEERKADIRKDIEAGRLNPDGSIPTSKYEDAQINQSFGKFGEKYGVPETPKGPQYFTQEGVQYMQQHYSKHFAAKENQRINEMLKEQLGEKAFEALKRGNPIDITPLK